MRRAQRPPNQDMLWTGCGRDEQRGASWHPNPQCACRGNLIRSDGSITACRCRGHPAFGGSDPGKDCALSISANFSCAAWGGQVWRRLTADAPICPNTINMSETAIIEAPPATETAPVKGMKKNGMRAIGDRRDPMSANHLYRQAMAR